MDREQEKQCPLCGGDNRCGNVAGQSACWCGAEVFPPELFDEIPEELLHKACVCQDCLKRFKLRRQS